MELEEDDDDGTVKSDNSDKGANGVEYPGNVPQFGDDNPEDFKAVVEPGEKTADLTFNEDYPCSSASMSEPLEINASTKKIINNTPDALPSDNSVSNMVPDVNNLSKYENKDHQYTCKDLTVCNINEIEKITATSPNADDGPLMKPDRTPIDESSTSLRSTIIQKLTQAMERVGIDHSGSNLLDRLRNLHASDKSNLIPSPTNSETDEHFTTPLTGTLLSVIEEVSSHLESCDTSPNHKVGAEVRSDSERDDIDKYHILLSKIESEMDLVASTSNSPCTKCQLCKKMVSSIHELAAKVNDLNNNEKCIAFIGLWRNIKTIIKAKVDKNSLSKNTECTPCRLCCGICSNYHGYAESRDFRLRAKIRTEFADIVKYLDPTTQVVLNSSVCSRSNPKVDSSKEILNDAVNLKQGDSKQAYVDAISENLIETPILAYPIVVKVGKVKSTKIKPALAASPRHKDLQVTSEFETPTDSFSSDNMDTSAGVNTIPVFETASRKDPSESKTSDSNSVSEKMRKELISKINMVISKEVKYLKKDLTDRILNSISPAISNTDLRSIGNAIKHSNDSDRSNSRISKQLNLSPSNFASSLYATPVLPVLSHQNKKLSKYDLLKQLPITEERNQQGMNKAVHQNYLSNIHTGKRKCPQKKEQHFHVEQTKQKNALRPARSSSEADQVSVQHKPSKHKLKARYRDNTLSNLTFPSHNDSQIVSFEENFVGALDSINLKLRSRESSSSTETLEDETTEKDESSSDADDIKSYCCVCDTWVPVQHSSTSQSSHETTTNLEKYLGSISQTDSSDTAQGSDDSGGRTDFTAYTAVVARKAKTKTQNTPQLALPKIKLDLPRSLTKNSSSSFVMNKADSKMYKVKSPASFLSNTSKASLKSNSKASLKSNSKASLKSASKTSLKSASKASLKSNSKIPAIPTNANSPMLTKSKPFPNTIAKPKLNLANISRVPPKSTIKVDTKLTTSNKKLASNSNTNITKPRNAIGHITLPRNGLVTKPTEGIHRKLQPVVTKPTGENYRKLQPAVTKPTGENHRKLQPVVTKPTEGIHRKLQPALSKMKLPKKVNSGGQKKIPSLKTPEPKVKYSKGSSLKPNSVKSNTAKSNPNSVRSNPNSAKSNPTSVKSNPNSMKSNSSLPYIQPKPYKQPTKTLKMPSIQYKSQEHSPQRKSLLPKTANGLSRTTYITTPKTSIKTNLTPKPTSNNSRSKEEKPPNTPLSRIPKRNSSTHQSIRSTKSTKSPAASETRLARRSTEDQMRSLKSKSKARTIEKPDEKSSTRAPVSASSSKSIGSKHLTSNTLTDSGVVLSKTKSFRITSVSKGVYINKTDPRSARSLHSATPDSLRRSAGSPAVSISFPKRTVYKRG